MLKIFPLGSVLIAVALNLGAPAQVRAAAPAEDWKGPADKSEVSVGALTGLGIYRGTAGFALLGTASKKLVHQGFASDITNSVSMETELGPLWVSGSTAFVYSLHLRWDFVKDEQWTLYGLGGLGGAITGVALGSKFDLLPRFGIGAFWKLADNVAARAELSHEFVALGVSFPL